MILKLATESTMVSDTDPGNDASEQPVIIENYANGEGVSIVGYDGDSVYIPYRLVKEVCKQMLEYAKPKKKK